jgi:predicted amidohydrolase YtcJ
LKLSGIDRDFQVTDGGPGYAEKDPQTGEPTGILRGCNRCIKSRTSDRTATEQDRYERLLALLRDYSSVGITGICDGSANPSGLELYQKMLDAGDLPVRVAAQYYIDTIGPIEQIQREHPRGRRPARKGGPMLRVIGIRTS